MSTKTTIKSGDGFHLYSDWLDECDNQDVINLRLDNVMFEANAGTGGCTSITVKIPRLMAEQLGLSIKIEES